MIYSVLGQRGGTKGEGGEVYREKEERGEGERGVEKDREREMYVSREGGREEGSRL